MAKIKMAAQVCEMLLLVAGIALLCSKDSFRSCKGREGNLENGENPDDVSPWGIGA
jgi:hypothetical protein